MRYVLSVIDHQTGIATAEEMAAIGAFNARLVAEGSWVMAAGLAAPNESLLVDARGETPDVSPGPLHHGSEYISGFWIIESPGLDDAVALAMEASTHCRRRVEVRAFLET